MFKRWLCPLLGRGWSGQGLLWPLRLRGCGCGVNRECGVYEDQGLWDPDGQRQLWNQGTWSICMISSELEAVKTGSGCITAADSVHHPQRCWVSLWSWKEKLCSLNRSTWVSHPLLVRWRCCLPSQIERRAARHHIYGAVVFSTQHWVSAISTQKKESVLDTSAWKCFISERIR